METSRRSSRSARLLLAALAALALLALAAPLASASSRLVWSNFAPSGVSGANLDGSGAGFDLSFASGGPDYPSGVAIDPAAGKIYWTDYSDNRIRGANLDGSEAFSVNTTGATLSAPTGLAIDADAGLVYWSNYLGASVSGANLDGSGGFDIDTTGATITQPLGIAIDPQGGRIYWANLFGGIGSAKLDGSGGGFDLGLSGATATAPFALALDTAAGRIYWSDWLGEKISGANLDGSGDGFDLATSGATLDKPRPLALDPEAKRVYWGNEESETFSYAALDGSGGAQLDTSGAAVSEPQMMALLNVPKVLSGPTVEGAGPLASSPTLNCAGAAWAADLVSASLYRAPRTIAWEWLRDGQPVAGAEAITLDPAQAGEYACRVSATNFAGTTSATSAAVAVTGGPPSSGPSTAAVRPAAPKLQLLAKQRQRAGNLRARVGCGPAACAVTLRGKLTVKLRDGRTRSFPLARKRVELEAGVSVKVALRLRRQATSLERIEALVGTGGAISGAVRLRLATTAPGVEPVAATVRLLLPRP